MSVNETNTELIVVFSQEGCKLRENGVAISGEKFVCFLYGGQIVVDASEVGHGYMDMDRECLLVVRGAEVELIGPLRAGSILYLYKLTAGLIHVRVVVVWPPSL
jgi:hypothetical protein